MSKAFFAFACFALAILSAAGLGAAHAQGIREKHAFYYDAGVPFATDGSLLGGVCFRVSGRVHSPDFFVNLRRIETPHGHVFLRGMETVTQFPDKLFLTYVIRDWPCDPEFHQREMQVYLTRELMSTMTLSLYWKNGVDMRPIKNSLELSSSVEAIVPYAKSLADELPKRFEWSWERAVPSAGVPITNSLVLIFRTPDGRIVARVAARL